MKNGKNISLKVTFVTNMRPQEQQQEENVVEEGRQELNVM
jgi:hypothetical protein